MQAARTHTDTMRVLWLRFKKKTLTLTHYTDTNVQEISQSTHQTETSNSQPLNPVKTPVHCAVTTGQKQQLSLCEDTSVNNHWLRIREVEGQGLHNAAEGLRAALRGGTHTHKHTHMLNAVQEARLMHCLQHHLHQQIC